MNFLLEGLIMAELAKIDRIISEVNSLEEKEKILFFYKIEEIFDNSNKTVKVSSKNWLEGTFQLMDKAGVSSNGKKWKREELYRG
jgi:hypothetical protein